MRTKRIFNFKYPLHAEQMKTILLIDDELGSNFVNARLLKSFDKNISVYVAMNGQEALEFLNRCKSDRSMLPDFIFLDIRMPVMDGFNFMRLYNEMGFDGKSNVIVSVLSSSENSDEVIRMEKLGVQYFFSKPLTAEDLKVLLG